MKTNPKVRLMKSLLFAVVVTHIVTHAHSIEVTYGGTGCPEGSALVEIDESGTITLKPSEYVITLNQGMKRKSCNLAIAVDEHVPGNYSVGFDEIHLTGSLDLKEHAGSILTGEAFLAGFRGYKFRDIKNGPLSESIVKQVTPNTNWSPCSESAILRLNTSLLLHADSADAQPSSIQVDDIKIKFATKPCL